MLFPEDDDNAQQWIEAIYPEKCWWNKAIGFSSEIVKRVSVPRTRSIHALASGRLLHTICLTHIYML
jgi:hypothetical protein